MKYGNITLRFLIYVLFIIVFSYSFMFLMGWRDLALLQNVNIHFLYAMLLSEIVTILFPIILHINKKNYLLSICLIFALFMSMGYGIFIPEHIISSITSAMGINSASFLFYLQYRFVFESITLILTIFYIFRHIRTTHSNTTRIPIIIYFCFLTLTLIIPLISTSINLLNENSYFQDSFTSFFMTPWMYNIPYWITMFFVQDATIFASFVFSMIYFVNDAKKINSQVTKYSKKKFIIIWILLGGLGAERLVVKSKYWITALQLSITFIGVIIYFNSWRNPSVSFTMNPFLYISLIGGFTIARTGIWVYSLLSRK